MAQVVWKYKFELDDIVKIRVPKGAQPLHVEEQGYDLCVWVKCDTETEESEDLILRIAGTGHPLAVKRDEKFYDPRFMGYINTFFTYKGALVFHAFWYIDPSEIVAAVEAESDSFYSEL